MLTDGSDVLQQGQQARLTGLSQAQGRLAYAAFITRGMPRASAADAAAILSRTLPASYRVERQTDRVHHRLLQDPRRWANVAPVDSRELKHQRYGGSAEPVSGIRLDQHRSRVPQGGKLGRKRDEEHGRQLSRQ